MSKKRRGTLAIPLYDAAYEAASVADGQPATSSFHRMSTGFPRTILGTFYEKEIQEFGVRVRLDAADFPVWL
jgi:hypothetical protein